MKKLTLLTAAALIAGTTFAMAQAGGSGGEPPKASDANPPGPTRMTPGESKSAPAQGMQAPPASGAMRQSDTGMPGGPGGTTAGTNPNAGAGAGTTGTGQKGGSGNQ